MHLVCWYLLIVTHKKTKFPMNYLGLFYKSLILKEQVLLEKFSSDCEMSLYYIMRIFLFWTYQDIITCRISYVGIHNQGYCENKIWNNKITTLHYINMNRSSEYKIWILNKDIKYRYLHGKKYSTKSWLTLGCIMHIVKMS